MDATAHWEAVYGSKADTELSWYQSDPRLSLELILDVSHGDGRIIDVGGGSSLLVDRLLEFPFERVAILDISRVALARSKMRLAERSARVEWIESDVTATGDIGQFDVWHDRAVFHFLTDPEDRQRYVRLARRTLPVGSHLILATFAINGPTRCSGLNVCRYDSRLLAAEVEDGFTLARELTETHVTPSGKPQEFFYGVFRRSGPS